MCHVDVIIGAIKAIRMDEYVHMLPVEHSIDSPSNPLESANIHRCRICQPNVHPRLEGQMPRSNRRIAFLVLSWDGLKFKVSISTINIKFFNAAIQTPLRTFN